MDPGKHETRWQLKQEFKGQQVAHVKGQTYRTKLLKKRGAKGQKSHTFQGRRNFVGVRRGSGRR